MYAAMNAAVLSVFPVGSAPKSITEGIRVTFSLVLIYFEVSISTAPVWQFSIQGDGGIPPNPFQELKHPAIPDRRHLSTCPPSQAQ